MCKDFKVYDVSDDDSSESQEIEDEISNLGLFPGIGHLLNVLFLDSEKTFQET